MHYDAVKNNHGLKHSPFKALVAPRPVGWISSIDEKGVCNLAPYSFFNAVSEQPTYVMFASAGIKDSVRNIEKTGEFVCSLATWELREHMNTSSAPVPSHVDEFPLARLTATPSRTVTPPRIKESPAALECKHWRTIQLPGADTGAADGYYVVFGQVLSIYIDDRFIHDGLVDTGQMRPIARLGYMDYGVINPDTVFTLNRPLIGDRGELIKDKGEWDGAYR